MRPRTLGIAGGGLVAAAVAVMMVSHHTTKLTGDTTPPAGALNPAVSQATISSTICVRGWTATVRPPLSFTAPLKLADIRRRRYSDTNPAHYEYDHFVPLELGGSPTSPANLWAEPLAQSKVKDRAENAGRAAVCSGQETLVQAQAVIVKGW